jgi:hypothetical protein
MRVGGEEAESVQAIMEELKDRIRAAPLLAGICDNGGITQPNGDGGRIEITSTSPLNRTVQCRAAKYDHRLRHSLHISLRATAKPCYYRRSAT